jgi:hypothetical protein
VGNQLAETQGTQGECIPGNPGSRWADGCRDARRRPVGQLRQNWSSEGKGDWRWPGHNVINYFSNCIAEPLKTFKAIHTTVRKFLEPNDVAVEKILRTMHYSATGNLMSFKSNLHTVRAASLLKCRQTSGATVRICTVDSLVHPSDSEIIGGQVLVRAETLMELPPAPDLFQSRCYAMYASPRLPRMKYLTVSDVLHSSLMFWMVYFCFFEKNFNELSYGVCL